MKILLPLLLLIFSIRIPAQDAPKFTDYPSKPIYRGKTAPIVLKKDDLTFRTRLRRASKNQKVNFAGHLILTFWGCGTSCVQGAAIDAQTGRIYYWGFFTAAIDAEEIVRYKIGSSLIIFHGMRNEQDGDNGDHYYKFTGQNFVEVKTILSVDQLTAVKPGSRIKMNRNRTKTDFK